KNHKPSAEGIRKIINYFGLKEENVLMVGDAVADVKAAHEAGIKIAAVVWDSYSKEKVLQMDVDFVFENVEEFRDFLKASLKSVPEGDGRSSKG
ncbi:MAG: HAD hydrolase-like protein, partial [Bacteroidetes bacterium]|nr:HAD hydrolase-like protein [Bacteroidota bacterium]